MEQETITFTLSLLALLSHLGLLFILVAYIFFKKSFGWLFNLIGQNGIILAFIVSLSSMVGSLYYSDIVGLEPCLMCWYARTMMYPLVFLFGMSIYKKRDKSIIPYGIILSCIGAVINIFHTYLQFWSNGSVACSPFGNQVSCSEKYFVMFGYISFPVLSLTAFILIVTALLFAKKYDSR